MSPARLKAWLKVKAFEEADFDLVGVRRKRGKPAMAMLARGRASPWQRFHHAAGSHSRTAVGVR